jgi:cyclin-D1-binding protein 1
VLVVISLLALTTETCATSRAALSQTHTPNSQSDSQDSAPPLPVLRKDLASILTLIHNLTTKISLALCASEPAYTASIAPLQDLLKYVSSLTTCATLFDAHGETMAEDIRNGSRGVLENLQVFSVALGSIVERGDEAGEDYLVRTGAVHESIDVFRRGIPEYNVTAVHHRWTKDYSMLEDSLAEVGDMVESNGCEDDEDDLDEEFGDEWDELGLGSTKKMNEKELQRTKQVCFTARHLC